jgi:hypothetical protein
MDDVLAGADALVHLAGASIPRATSARRGTTTSSGASTRSRRQPARASRPSCTPPRSAPTRRAPRRSGAGRTRRRAVADARAPDGGLRPAEVVPRAGPRPRPGAAPDAGGAPAQRVRPPTGRRAGATADLRGPFAPGRLLAKRVLPVIPIPRACACRSSLRPTSPLPTRRPWWPRRGGVQHRGRPVLGAPELAELLGARIVAIPGGRAPGARRRVPRSSGPDRTGLMELFMSLPLMDTDTGQDGARVDPGTMTRSRRSSRCWPPR